MSSDGGIVFVKQSHKLQEAREVETALQYTPTWSVVNARPEEETEKCPPSCYSCRYTVEETASCIVERMQWRLALIVSAPLCEPDMCNKLIRITGSYRRRKHFLN